MVEVTFGGKVLEPPYTLTVPGVSEEQFDELVEEDIRAELIDGVMIVHSPVSPRHDVVSDFVRGLLRIFTRRRRLGLATGPDVLVRLARSRKFCPDAFFFAQARVPRPLPMKEFEGPPDLVLEVLSPHNRDHDLNVKRPAYRKAGVGEIWLIDPEAEEVLIDRKQKRGYRTTQLGEGRLESIAVPGFWIDLAWLWQDEMPDDWECLNLLLTETE
jgi:Uma2 family endonuclease